MDEILDQAFEQSDRSKIRYGGFWSRFGASFIDGLILMPVSFGLSYLNITSWKSAIILVIFSMVTLSYKPVMEFVYGATLGKMALRLRVTNLEFENASLGEILLRNIFHLTPGLISLFFTIGVYTDPGFESVDGFGDFTIFLQGFPILQYINYVVIFITLVDVIVLISDPQKRSLHDKIGGTFVIER
jgi:uncharacterized RDD family membrane protein YckC